MKGRGQKPREASIYVPRAKILRRLNLSLSEFRRLCILKGIYPRIPKGSKSRLNEALSGKKKKGDRGSSEKVYYHVKDLEYLKSEKLLGYFKDEKRIKKRIRKLVTKKDHFNAKLLAQRFTQGNAHNAFVSDVPLDHIIKERYPSFLSSLEDMDDGLSCICTMLSLGSSWSDGINGKVVAECEDLYNLFLAYVCQTQTLASVFVSIKGFYYAIKLFDRDIVWIQPHQFNAGATSAAVVKNGNAVITAGNATAVDLKVLSTFLLFYKCLLKNVLYKLFRLKDLHFPTHRPLGKFYAIALKPERSKSDSAAPETTAASDSAGPATASSDSAEPATASSDSAEPATASSDSAPSAAHQSQSEEPKMEDMSLKAQNQRKVFAQQVVFVSRETPIDSVVFVLKCGGVKTVGWQDLDEEKSSSPIKSPNDPSITHHIVDRPQGKGLDTLRATLPSRVYVQPQWVFDSFNAGKLLPASLYEPGIPPPPHKSPFVAAESDDEEDEVVETAPLTAADELEHEEVKAVLEATSKSTEEPSLAEAVAKERSSRAKKAQQLESERRKMALTKKKRDMFRRVEAREKAEQTKANRIKEKRQKLKAAE